MLRLQGPHVPALSNEVKAGVFPTVSDRSVYSSLSYQLVSFAGGPVVGLQKGEWPFPLVFCSVVEHTLDPKAC